MRGGAACMAAPGHLRAFDPRNRRSASDWLPPLSFHGRLTELDPFAVLALSHSITPKQPVSRARERDLQHGNCRQDHVKEFELAWLPVQCSLRTRRISFPRPERLARSGFNRSCMRVRSSISDFKGAAH
jgi:hypothetical protein